MEYVYATLLLHEVKAEITREKIHAMLASVGIPVDQNQITVLVDALDGVDIGNVLERISVPSVPVVVPPPTVEQEVVKVKPVEDDGGVGLDKLFG